MMSERCFLCWDINPAYSDVLCDAHRRLRSVKRDVQTGVCSDWLPLPTQGGGYAPMRHDGMQTSAMIRMVRQRRLKRRGQAGVYRYTQLMAELGTVLAQCGVAFDDSGRDTDSDLIAELYNITARWLWCELYQVFLQQRGRRAA